MYDVNDNIVGWFGKENANSLTGFYIMPEYRSQKEVWEAILSNFDRPLKTGLYLKNYRAIKAMNKLGFKIISQSNTPLGLAVVMELVCQ